VPIAVLFTFPRKVGVARNLSNSVRLVERKAIVATLVGLSWQGMGLPGFYHNLDSGLHLLNEQEESRREIYGNETDESRFGLTRMLRQ
jgi:hypothetical protein